MADVIFHGNCLDGCYSGMVTFTFLNLLARYCKRPLLDIIGEFFKAAKNNLVDDPTVVPLGKEFMEVPNTLPGEVRLYDKTNSFHSLTPGTFTEGFLKTMLKTEHRVVILVDCYAENTENLYKLAAAYQYVLIIDHHTTALESLKAANSKHPNILYYFTEEKCAFELTIDFFSRFFGFDKWCPPKLFEYFVTASKYVRANDLKLNETFRTKHFTLGIFDLNLEMSSHNSGLFRRLAAVDLELTLSRGRGTTWQ